MLAGSYPAEWQRVLLPPLPCIAGPSGSFNSVSGGLCEDPYTCRDWQADKDHVHEQTLSQGFDGEWAHCERDGRERQHDEVHDEKDGNPVEEAADDEVVAEKSEPAASQVINGRCRNGDEEMQREAKEPCRGPPGGSARTEHAAGDAACHSPAEGDEGGGCVEGAGYDAANQDGKDRRLHVRRSWGCDNVHFHLHVFRQLGWVVCECSPRIWQGGEAGENYGAANVFACTYRRC